MADKSEQQAVQGDLASFLKDWMAEHSFNQSRLAKRLGIHRSVLGDVLSRGAIPKSATLRRMALTMGVPISTLLVKAGCLTYEDLEVSVADGLDESVALRLAKYPKEFQRAVATQFLPALEQMAQVLHETRADYGRRGTGSGVRVSAEGKREARPRARK